MTMRASVSLTDEQYAFVRTLVDTGRYYWFDVVEARRTVRVLAVFFGGQDHLRHMLRRLLED